MLLSFLIASSCPFGSLAALLCLPDFGGDTDGFACLLIKKKKKNQSAIFVLSCLKFKDLWSLSLKTQVKIVRNLSFHSPPIIGCKQWRKL